MYAEERKHSIDYARKKIYMYIHRAVCIWRARVNTQDVEKLSGTFNLKKCANFLLAVRRNLATNQFYL